MFNFDNAKLHFLFNYEVFDHVDRAAMGSPLGPIFVKVISQGFI